MEPALAITGNTFARFRVTENGDSDHAGEVAVPTGAAANGEVEDHLVTVNATDVLFAQDFNMDALGLMPDGFTHDEEKGVFRSPGNNIRNAVSTIIAPQVNGDVNLTTQVTMTPSDGARIFSNGFLVFDYVNGLNYKLAGIEAKNRLWVISEVVDGEYRRVATRSDASISQTGTYTLNVAVTGSNVTLQTTNGSLPVNQTEFSNSRDLTTGSLGVGTILAVSRFDDLEVRRIS